MFDEVLQTNGLIVTLIFMAASLFYLFVKQIIDARRIEKGVQAEGAKIDLQSQALIQKIAEQKLAAETALREDLDATRRDLDSARDKLSELERELFAVTFNRDATQERLGITEKLLLETAEKARIAEDRAELAMQERNTQAETLVQLRGEVDLLNAGVVALNEEMRAMASEKETLLLELQDARTVIARKDSEIAERDRALVERGERIRELEVQVAALQQQVGDIQAKSRELQARVDFLEARAPVPNTNNVNEGE